MITLWQNMLSRAFKTGLYDGIVTIGELKRHGQFGIGEFEALDGELIVWDRAFYRATADGQVRPANDSERLCFAQVSDFAPQYRLDAPAGLTNVTAPQILGKLLATRNTIYAIAIEGVFDAVTAIAFDRQKKPYPLYADALKSPQVFRFPQVKGRIIGYYSPLYFQDIGIPGFHFHFLADDLAGGGHVTEFVLSEGVVSLAEINRFLLDIPTSEDFRGAHLE